MLNSNIIQMLVFVLVMLLCLLEGITFFYFICIWDVWYLFSDVFLGVVNFLDV